MPTELYEDRFCQLEGCRRRIPLARGGTAIYCSKEHTTKAGWQRQAKKRSAAIAAKQKFEAPREYQLRTGDVYRRLRDDPMLPLLLDGTITASAAATKLDVTTAAVTRALHAFKVDGELAELQAEWEPSWRVKAMLPKAKVDRIKELGHRGVGTEEFERLVDELVQAYSAFSRWYFNLEGKRPLIKEFHLEWIRSIIVAYATGGKQLILSPPRVGKSETLIRFCVWFITMDPNIRIGWFCAGTDVAKLMLGSVKDYFENHEEFISDTLPPGQTYKPDRSTGRAWNAKEIKVAQQSHIGAKSSSLLALGRTSKFLSRDMDIIIIDDMEDFDDTNEAHMREKGRQKLAEIGTRKTEDTAEVYIGSRQHPDDIPNYIMNMEGSILQWQVIVNSAHDENCGEDPDDLDAHWDCMLFPEVRSYRYLMEKKLEMETLGLQHAYPMRYLNAAIPPEGQVFNMETIRDVGLNRDRGIGLDGLPPGYLVGGLDPSARGIQASFLWHYRQTEEFPVKMAMVDLDTMQSGGVAGAVQIILLWYQTYDLTLWYYETNSQQAEFYKLVKAAVEKAMVAEYGHNPIHIKEHSTGKNKQDAELGISAMAPLYHSGAVDLPYGTNEARQKTNLLLRQLELWTTDGVKSKTAKTDIKLAQWFPFVGKIQSFLKKNRKPVLREADTSSYPDAGYTQAPWASNYPGG